MRRPGARMKGIPRHHEAPTPAWPQKGLPVDTDPVHVTGAVIGRNLFDGSLVLPTMVLLESALDHDIRLMARYFAAAGVSHAPHGKTTMSPSIWRRQLDAGAWAITVATAWQAAVAVAAGVPRILIANEVVDAGSLAWLRASLALDGPEIMTQVDSAEAVALLVSTLDGSLRRLPVLIDVGQTGARTGARFVEAALSVARAVAAAPPLRLAGVTAFEGASPGSTPAGKAASMDELLGMMREVAERIAGDVAADGGTELVVSAGGSKAFDIVIERLGAPYASRLPVRLVIRSGSAVTHDHGLYAATSPLRAPKGGWPALRAALEVWAPVLSRPEDALAILGAGRRDLPYDAGMPIAIKVRHLAGVVEAAVGIEITALNDQHAFARLAQGADLRVGDLVGLGISHPCSAFDRWRWIPVVDDDYRIRDLYETVF
jgi:D-serine deaminase-like pyridoxal phosphate-dependent protein